MGSAIWRRKPGTGGEAGVRARRAGPFGVTTDPRRRPGGVLEATGAGADQREAGAGGGATGNLRVE